MITQTENVSPAELARRVADEYQARDVLRNTRPSLLQCAAAFAWFIACIAAMGEMTGPWLVKMLLFCATAQVPLILIDASIQRRKLDAVVKLLQQSKSDSR